MRGSRWAGNGTQWPPTSALLKRNASELIDLFIGSSAVFSNCNTANTIQNILKIQAYIVEMFIDEIIGRPGAGRWSGPAIIGTITIDHLRLFCTTAIYNTYINGRTLADVYWVPSTKKQQDRWNEDRFRFKMHWKASLFVVTFSKANLLKLCCGTAKFGIQVVRKFNLSASSRTTRRRGLRGVASQACQWPAILMIPFTKATMPIKY